MANNKRDRLEPELMRLIRQGMTLRAACDVLGIHRSTGQRWLKAAAEAEKRPVQPKRKPYVWWQDDSKQAESLKRRIHERFVEMWESGSPVFQHMRPRHDDPRLSDLAKSSDDPVIVELRTELAGLGHRLGILT